MFRFKCNVFLKLLFYLLLSVVLVQAKISDKRLCVDLECKEPASLGKTLLRYSRSEDNILSFPPNAEVIIYSKSAGSNPDLWGVEINGKRGYAPYNFIRETKILKIPDLLLDTEYGSSSPKIEVPSENSQGAPHKVPKPDPVQKPYEIVDGTKIPIDVGVPLNENTFKEVKTDETINTSKDNLNENIVEQSGDENKKEVNAKPETEARGHNAGVVGNILSSISNFMSEVDSKNKELIESAPENTDEDEDSDDDLDEEDLEDDEEDDDFEDDDFEDEENIETTNSSSKDGSIKDSSTEKIVVEIIKNESEVQSSEKILVPKEGLPSGANVDINRETLQSFESNIGRNLLQVNENDDKEDDSEVVTENLENKSLDSNTFSADTKELNKEQIKSIEGEGQNTDTKTADSEDQNTETKTTDGPNRETKTTDESQNIETKAIDSEHQNTETKTIGGEGQNIETNTIESEGQNIENKTADDKDENIKNKSDDNKGQSTETKTVNGEGQNLETKPFGNEGQYVETKSIANKDNAETKTTESENQTPQTKTTGDEGQYTETKTTEIEGQNIETKTSKDGQHLETKPLGDEGQNLNENDSSVLIEQLIPSPNNFSQNESEFQTKSEEPPLVQLEISNTLETVTQVPYNEENDDYINIGNAEEVTTPNPELSTENVKIDNLEPNYVLDSISDDTRDETINASEILQSDENPEIKSTENAENRSEQENSEIQSEEFEIKSDNVEITVGSSETFKMKPENIFEIKHENFAIKEEIQKQEIVGENQNEGANILQSDNSYGNVNDLYRTLQEKSNEMYVESHNNGDEEMENHSEEDGLISRMAKDNEYCTTNDDPTNCGLVRKTIREEVTEGDNIMDLLFNLSNDVVLVVLITAGTILIFLWGYIYIDKSSRIRPLVAKINQLEKALLLSEQENKALNEKLLQVQNEIYDHVDSVSNDAVESLKEELELAQNARASLEEQIAILEKELENSTEVGLELNRMLSDFLSSQNSDTLVANIEQLQRQLVEQQSTINTYTETLSMKETEIHELRLELEISNSKVTDLQKDNQKITSNLLKIEEEKDELQNKLESEIDALKRHIEQLTISSTAQINKLSDELKDAQKRMEDAQRLADIKTKEYNLLKENTEKLRNMKGDDIKSLLDVSATRAEIEMLKKENESLLQHCEQTNEIKNSFEKQYESAINELQALKARFDEVDKAKLEALTKLEVLENYFKEREAQLQKELAKHESLFMEKQGEAYSITEKIKFMQEELQNYKAQNESLKQEIVEQEVQLKSQISLLEKRVHENWVNARQAERKLEEAKQEAAQLRNRMTLRERTINDEKLQNRLKSPAEQNGELPVSPTPASPPLLFGSRDLTTSPPIPGLPPPFLPPPGVPVPFMPPPIPGAVPPPFMPPPPSMFPGDRRPAPLGRMSSPPVNSRYSPDSRAYSPYSRNSPSPTSDDDYRDSPPSRLHRDFSPINDRRPRREYRRSPEIVKNSRNKKGSMHSSGSANSNESIEKINRKSSKV